MSGIDPDLEPAVLRMVRSLAGRVLDLDYRVRSVARASQARDRSTEGGAQELYDEDDELRAIVGELADGTYGVQTYGGLVPAAPSQPLVSAYPGGVTVTWDGYDVNDELGWPDNFLRVNVHLDTAPGEPPTLDNLVGSIESEGGGALSFSQPPDVVTYVQLVALTTSGVTSPPSVESEVISDELEATGPTLPPADSPAVEVSGTVDSLIITTEQVDPSSWIEYHLSTTDAFVPDVSTLVGTSPSNVFVATRLPDGTPLQLDTAYYVRVVAANIIGQAAPSAQVPAELDATKASEAAYARLTGGFILAGEVEVGPNIRIDPVNGIVITLPDGEIRLPANGVTDARITAHLTARSLDVEDNANFYGLSQVQGAVRLGNGITNPTTDAGVSETWDSIQIANDGEPIGGEGKYGLAESSDGTSWCTAFTFGGLARIIADKITGAYIVQYSAGTNVTNFTPEGGMVLVGGKYYVLGRDWGRSFRRFIYRCDGATFAKEAEWEITNSFATLPVIGHDHLTDDLLLAWISSGGNTLVQVRDVTDPTVQIGSNINLGTPPSGASTAVKGVARGEFDLGAGVDRLMVAFNNPGTVYCYNGDTEARVAARDFPVAGGGIVNGFVWEDGQFWHLGGNGKVWEYDGGVTQETSTDVAYTWYDATGATHETRFGASQVTYSRKARTLLKVETPPAPQVDVIGNPEAANQIRVYAAPTGSAPRLQATLALGVRTVELSTLDTGSATEPAANGFDGLGVTPGRIESAAVSGSDPLVELNGDGSFALLGSNLTATSAVAAVAPFSGSVKFERIGKRVTAIGNIDRASGSSTAFTDTGVVIPVGYRPPANETLEGKVFFNAGGASYRYRVTAAGALEVQMSAASTQNMTLNDSWFTA